METFGNGNEQQEEQEEVFLVLLTNLVRSKTVGTRATVYDRGQSKTDSWHYQALNCGW